MLGALQAPHHYTGQADIILANSKFTARVTKSYFKTITQSLRVVYPGINVSAYESAVDPDNPDNIAVFSYVFFLWKD